MYIYIYIYRRPSTKGGNSISPLKFQDENEYDYNYAAEVTQQAKDVKNLEKWEAKTQMSNSLSNIEFIYIYIYIDLYSFHLNQSIQKKMLKTAAFDPTVNTHNINSITRSLYPSLIQHSKSKQALVDAKLQAEITTLKLSAECRERHSEIVGFKNVENIRDNIPESPRSEYSKKQLNIGGKEEELKGAMNAWKKNVNVDVDVGVKMGTNQQGKLIKMKNPMKKNWTQMFKQSELMPLREKRKIEEEIHMEYTRLKTRMNEIKEERKVIFSENNEIYSHIVKSNEAIKVHTHIYIYIYI